MSLYIYLSLVPATTKSPPPPKKPSKEKDLIYPASLPPYGAGFQSNSIIDGSQSPQTALLCRCIVAWRRSSKRVSGSSGRKCKTREHTQWNVRKARSWAHTATPPAGRLMQNHANSPEDVHSSARRCCSLVSEGQKSADLNGQRVISGWHH